MADLSDIKDLLEGQGKAFLEFKKAQDERIKTLETELNNFAKKAARPGVSHDDGQHSPEEREHKQAFIGYLRTGRDRDLEAKAMSTDNDPNGGYLVPVQIDSTISKALRELSPMRQLANVVPVATGEYSMLHSVGGTAYSWVGEKQDRPETTGPRFEKRTPPLGEIYASPAITQNLLDDNNFNLESWLSDELSEAFGEGEGVAFINGDGINKPRGILTYDIANTADACALKAYCSMSPPAALEHLPHPILPTNSSP